MKIFIALVAFVTTSNFAFANNYTCKSANYTIVLQEVIADEGSDSTHVGSANYGINNVMNDGADVTAGPTYFSSDILTTALNVDGQPYKFQLTAFRVKGKKDLEGRIYANGGKSIQKAVCTVTQ